MPQVRGCDLPDELLYDVENNMWYRENADGTVTLGMTSVAAAMAGQLVAFTPKKAGRSVSAGKSCGTVESGKWVGPAKIAFDAEVAEVNDALGGVDPILATEDAPSGPEPTARAMVYVATFVMVVIDRDLTSGTHRATSSTSDMFGSSWGHVEVAIQVNRESCYQH